MQGCDPGHLSPPVSRKQDMHLTVSTSSSSEAITDQILSVWVQKVKKKSWELKFLWSELTSLPTFQITSRKQVQSKKQTPGSAPNYGSALHHPI